MYKIPARFMLVSLSSMGSVRNLSIATESRASTFNELVHSYPRPSGFAAFQRNFYSCVFPVPFLTLLTAKVDSQTGERLVMDTSRAWLLRY